MTQIRKGPHSKPIEIADTLRRRMLAGIRSGVLARGDRLPSTRDLARQLSADPRAILAAYRTLEGEGLVEMRPRSGIYVAGRPGAGPAAPGLAEPWLVDLFAQGIGRDIAAPDLAEWLRRSIETLRMRVVVIAPTIDQREGLCRELRADFGLEATGLEPRMLAPDDSRVPIEVRRADFLLATSDVAAPVRSFAQAQGKRVVTISIRPDLIGPEWRTLLQEPSYAVVMDPLFGGYLQQYFNQAAGATNLRTIVLGVDDLASIPEDAPTYVTRAARAQLGDTPVPGRLIPTARTLSPDTTKEVLEIIVRSNLAVVATRNLASP